MLLTVSSCYTRATIGLLLSNALGIASVSNIQSISLESQYHSTEYSDLDCIGLFYSVYFQDDGNQGRREFIRLFKFWPTSQNLTASFAMSTLPCCFEIKQIFGFDL